MQSLSKEIGIPVEVKYIGLGAGAGRKQNSGALICWRVHF
jgi:hypothetical protein